MLAVAVLEDDPDIDDEGLRDALSSNLCRCTGYHGIVRAVLAVAADLRAARSTI
jgi:carbon-monoxide dehydrogenase small subunit